MSEDPPPKPTSRASALFGNPRNVALRALRDRTGQLNPAFRPRDLDDAKLKGLNHGEWLEDFSRILALQTGVQMTPKREGTITRLHWASLMLSCSSSRFATRRSRSSVAAWSRRLRSAAKQT